MYYEGWAHVVVATRFFRREIPLAFFDRLGFVGWQRRGLPAAALSRSSLGAIAILIASGLSVARAQDDVFVTKSGCAVQVRGGHVVDVDWSGNCVEHYTSGIGVLTESSNEGATKYVGEMKRGAKEGPGTLYTKDGTITGDFFANEIHGLVTYHARNGTTYSGEWQNGPEGFGTRLSEAGTVYTGHFHEGKAQGRGYLILPSGAEYIGQFSNGRYNGWGVLLTPNQDKYEGNWLSGSMSGRGRIATHDGLQFDGELRNGERVGMGVLSSISGDRYEGNWDHDEADGQGTLTRADGITFSGIWKDGCLKVGDTWVTLHLDTSCSRKPRP